MQPRSVAGYGWKNSLPRPGDATFQPGASALPASVDLRQFCPPVYDQGELGSCTGNALSAALQFVRRREGLPDFVPSRLFIYWCERQIEGTAAYDSGAQIRDGIEVLSLIGAPPEQQWEYIEANFATMPPPAAFTSARLDRAVQFMRVQQDIAHMRACLAEGFPFVCGISVFKSFETDQVASSGMVSLPSRGETLVGGHAVMAVGCNDATQRFIVRNSWGPNWGQGGYFELPYAYLIDPSLAADFWTIRLV